MNLKLKAVFSIIAVLSLAMALTPGVAFAAEVPSSFSCGSSQPEIVGEITTGEDTIIPDVPNTINFSVSDANTLADIESITVYLYYDADGVYAEPTGNESADVHTFVILTWTPEGGWTIEPTGTMWEIDTANCVTPDLGSTSGDFVLSYIPSPVAQESVSDDDAEWHIFLVVDDGSTTPVTSYTEDLEMAWYGSVTINTAGVHWGEVTPGMDFAEGAPSEIADISVNYICNGAYDEQVASTATWAGNTSTATLTADASNANEFALRADDTTDLVSAVTVADTYTAIDDTGAITEEAGDTVITNSVWLKLNATFASDTYAGAIYYQIAQGTY